MKKVVELIEQVGAKGIQIQIAGAHQWKKIARVELIREGSNNSRNHNKFEQVIKKFH